MLIRIRNRRKGGGEGDHPVSCPERLNPPEEWAVITLLSFPLVLPPTVARSPDWSEDY